MSSPIGSVGRKAVALEEERSWWRNVIRSVVDDFFTALDPANVAIIQDAIAKANR